MPQEWKDASIQGAALEQGQGGVWRLSRHLIPPCVARWPRYFSSWSPPDISGCCEREGLLPETQSGLGPNRSTVGVMLVAQRLHELARKGVPTPLSAVFIYLTKACNSVDRKLLLSWPVLTQPGVPPEVLAAIRQLHDGTRAQRGDGRWNVLPLV